MFSPLIIPPSSLAVLDPVGVERHDEDMAIRGHGPHSGVVGAAVDRLLLAQRLQLWTLPTTETVLLVTGLAHTTLTPAINCSN